jgi:sulfur-carrier protein adenylyltransferase/sulfurtransferase
MPSDQLPQIGLPALSREEILRYSRHLILPEVGMEGQQRLKAARVLCVGAGGLGSPVTMYLAAAGVGTIGIADFDVVDFSNLQRQIVHGTPDVGRSKLASAADRLGAINPGVRVQTHETALTSANAMEILGQYDIVVDGTDNFPTRYLINDACVLARKPNVFGSVFRFEGQVSVFAAPGGPCYRCLYPEPPPPGLVPSCAEAGVLGVLPGVIGTLQATETTKLILGVGDSLAGRFVVFDALRMRFRELRLRRDPECPACGDSPTITRLVDYDQLCGVTAAREKTTLHPEAEITSAELKLRLDQATDEIVLLDVREPLENKLCAIPGSLLIPLGELPRRLDELDGSRELVVYCKVGVRSAAATHFLRSKGFGRARNLVGGILDWIDKVDPSQPRY